MILCIIADLSPEREKWTFSLVDVGLNPTLWLVVLSLGNKPFETSFPLYQRRLALANVRVQKSLRKTPDLDSMQRQRKGMYSAEATSMGRSTISFEMAI